jgi:hypothetical protein
MRHSPVGWQRQQPREATRVAGSEYPRPQGERWGVHPGCMTATRFLELSPRSFSSVAHGASLGQARGVGSKVDGVLDAPVSTRCDQRNIA